ncbi:MAG TPA: Crp/Fnr family transcriptional regulator [Thermoanaerobaculia bacterium]|nr:Crp/Fnr family transcriptional regulator [Thermoanaerobaculia bacterium]
MQAHSCGACAAESSFCALPEPVREAFGRLKTSVVYRAGDAAFHEGDPCRSVYVVCSGRMKLMTASRDGRLLLLGFARPGEILAVAEALRDGAPYECSAIAAEPAVLSLVPRETFLRFLASYPQAARRITISLSDQYWKAQREEKFLGLGDRSASRLAHLLLDWSSERGRSDDDGVHIPMHVTHTDLAQAIGSTRETVTRILSDFSHRGIVERRPDEIVIHSTDALTRIGTI